VHQAEDAVQEALVRAAARWGRLLTPGGRGADAAPPSAGYQVVGLDGV
jgi:hypothetical protein